MSFDSCTQSCIFNSLTKRASYSKFWLIPTILFILGPRTTSYCEYHTCLCSILTITNIVKQNLVRAFPEKYELRDDIHKMKVCILKLCPETKHCG